MKQRFYEVFGWYGAIVILLAYALVSFGLLGANTLIYQLLNLTGAIGIVAISLTKKNYQPAFLNAVWALVAVAAIIAIALSLSKL